MRAQSSGLPRTVALGAVTVGASIPRALGRDIVERAIATDGVQGVGLAAIVVRLGDPLPEANARRFLLSAFQCNRSVVVVRVSVLGVDTDLRTIGLTDLELFAGKYKRDLFVHLHVKRVLKRVSRLS